MLKVDLRMLENDERFQAFCLRLAQCDFPETVPIAVGSWDGGRDLVRFSNSNDEGDVIWQCKFTLKGLNSSLKNKIRQSLDSLDKKHKVRMWILCLSIDATGKFYNWLREVIVYYPFIKDFQVWDQQQLLQRLEKHPDVLETFFYRAYKELERYFRIDELELIGFDVDQASGWIACDPKILYFARKDNTESDLVFDIIVRNRGTLEALLREIKVELTDVRRGFRGIPGEALLFPQITYVVSLKNGEQGLQFSKLDLPLLVKSGAHERFKVRCTDVGSAWSGALRFTLKYGKDKELTLPWVRIFA
jgi:hypothetical protein